MALLTRQKFSFISRGMDKEAFTVVSFKGIEAVSTPYEFDILLVSDLPDIDPLQVLENPAAFTIHRDQEDDVDFNGILMQFEETRKYHDYYFFRAVLVPKFWWLSLTRHNQVFLDKTAPEIMEDALKDGGLAPGVDFSFNLINTYLPFEYICQYDETHFNFVSRWAEREGIYYFFEQTPSGEKIIFTDSKLEHKDLVLGKDLIYDPPSGLSSLHTKEVIQSFTCQHNMLPQKIHLKDYNYLKPSMAIEGMADVDAKGRGENYIYGVNFDDPKEGNRLAAIRADALLCRKSEFYGESSVPFIVPGYTFDLNEHYKKMYNRKYLVTRVAHDGHQTGYLIAGLSNAVTPRDEEMFYSNRFTAIYSDKQFRPPHDTEKPRISGTIHAKIDAAGSGQYAEIDEYGRYKVILPFDLSGRFGGKASAWFRMMQPCAGENQGMHFPLHKGTEVLLTFIDGNPDRPVIAGAVPNPETTSPVKDENQTKSIITTGRNTPDSSAGAAEKVGRTTSGTWTTTPKANYIEFEDLTADEHIAIHSDGDLWFEAQNRYGEYRTMDLGGSTADPQTTSFPDPPSVDTLLNKFVTSTVGTASTPPTYAPTGMLDRHNTHAAQEPFESKVFKYAHVHVSSMDTVNTQEGNVYDFGGYWVYNMGNAYIENHISQKPVLNSEYDEDLLTTGGPYWKDDLIWPEDYTAPKSGASTIQTTLEKSAKLLKKATNEINCKKNSKGKWTNSSSEVWVEKKFGDSYDYAEGGAVSVHKGDTLDILHGGQHTDIVYRGDGSLKELNVVGGCADAKKETKKWTSAGILHYDYIYTKNGNIRTTKEIKNVREDGRPLATTTKVEYDNYIKTDSWSVIETNGSNVYASKKNALTVYGAATSSLTLSAAASASVNIYFAGSLSFDISPLSVKGSFGLYIGGKVDINLFGGLFAKINAGLAFGVDIDFLEGGKLVLDADKGVDWKSTGFRAQLEAAAKVKKKAAALVEKGEISIGNETIKIKNYTAVKIDT